MLPRCPTVGSAPAPNEWCAANSSDVGVCVPDRPSPERPPFMVAEGEAGVEEKVKEPRDPGRGMLTPKGDTGGWVGGEGVVRDGGYCRGWDPDEGDRGMGFEETEWFWCEPPDDVLGRP